MAYLIPSLFFLLGGCIGYFSPPAAEKTAQYKRGRQNRPLAPDPRYQHPLLRIGLAILGAAYGTAAGLYSQGWATPVFLLLIFTLCVLFSLIDIRIRIVPNEMILAGILLGLAYRFALFGLSGVLNGFVSMAAVMAVFILLARILGYAKIGAGDVKLAGVMALMLGYPDILNALLIMSMAVILYSLVGLITHKLSVKSYFPFAPFMMLGQLIAVILPLLLP